LTAELHKEERTLLASLTQLESEASFHTQQLQMLQEEIDAAKLALNGIRSELLDNFLFENLETQGITYVATTDDDGEILLNVSPIAGKELEYEKFKAGISWADMSAVPLFYVLAYLGKGVPWTTTETTLYNV
jgi:hypothetical protein